MKPGGVLRAHGKSCNNRLAGERVNGTVTVNTELRHTKNHIYLFLSTVYLCQLHLKFISLVDRCSTIIDLISFFVYFMMFFVCLNTGYQSVQNEDKLGAIY